MDVRLVILSNSLGRLHTYFTDVALAKNTFYHLFSIVSKPIRSPFRQIMPNAF